MGPRTLVMGIVIRPQEIVDQVVLLRKFESDRIVLKRRRAVFAKIVTRELLELGEGPHMMSARSLIHRIERPWHPADAAFDSREAQLGKTLEHARRAQTRDRLNRRRERMCSVIDNGAAILARR